ncbi:MAG: 3' terminal RNA ribose 2'-O-methyltransferase Hen1 [Candidatus Obscuribacterales bacterium]|nr:3' terminal RNA ribose 2'-O-methyltransferase Hen1 [Candidatus Obscuribacterales bacterium]
MFISVTTTHNPATDLGYLIVKNPATAPHRFSLPFGEAILTYTEISPDRCTAVMTLDINPVELVRGREGSQGGGTIDEYLNDRPYCSSSILAVALRRVFSSALSGKNKDRQELAKTRIPLECTIGALPSRRGPVTIRDLFEPLGYNVVDCTRHALDPLQPEWGDSDYHTVTIRGTVTVQELMTHLFILIPVLDNDKHYFVGDAEVEKLLRHGNVWLATHPLNEMIVNRYLGNKKHLAAKALGALAELVAPEDEESDGEADGATADGQTPATPREDVEKTISLHQIRHETVVRVLKERGVKRVVDMGCGRGLFVGRLMDDAQFEQILGMEVELRAVSGARYKLKLHKQPAEKRDRVKLVQGSVTYRDSILRQKFDAAVSIEVIEHMEPTRLDMFAMVMLGDCRPRIAVVTTPNREYNCLWPTLPAGELRHKDHRFEWTRSEFEQWCSTQAARYGYATEFQPIGPLDDKHGAPSQMCVFTRLSDDPVELPEDALPCVETLLAGRRMDTELRQGIEIERGHAVAAFENVNRFAVAPQWMIYVPPTMSPSETSRNPAYLEHPREALDFYARHGVGRVVCQQKHMGSRAVVVVCRDQEVARKRFGINDPLAGSCYTRMGRRFFTDDNLEMQFMTRVRAALTRSRMWEELNTDWVALDCELMPWSAKARELIRRQFAALGAAAHAAIPLAISAMEQAQRLGQNVGADLAKLQERLLCANLFRQAYNQYCWPVDSIEDYKLAPFHLLASEGAVHSDKDNVWHMETLGRVADASTGMVIRTPYHVVDTSDADQVSRVVSWWEQLTEAGGEGMVVKPFDFLTMDRHGPIQPAIKCRGREYLRIIYGPDYTMPEHMDRLRERGLSTKRSLALKEFALGMESLQRFVRGHKLGYVHQYAFAVLALESEPVDPRL